MTGYAETFAIITHPADDETLFLACPDCDEPLCPIEPGDTLRVLAQVADDHRYACTELNE